MFKPSPRKVQRTFLAKQDFREILLEQKCGPSEKNKHRQKLIQFKVHCNVLDFISKSSTRDVKSKRRNGKQKEQKKKMNCEEEQVNYSQTATLFRISPRARSQTV